MPPQGKKAVPAQSNAGPRGAAVPEKSERRAKPPFSRAVVMEAVLGSGANSVCSKLPARFADGELERAWRAWEASVPEHLSEIPAGQSALPLQMPMKYTATPEAAPAPAPERVQQELMTYRNPNGGTSYGKQERDRDALATRRLRSDEVPVGSIVALRRDASDPWAPAGYGTPFYVGDVLAIQQEEAAGSSSTASAYVTSIDVHYRMPRFGSTFCNDVTKPLKLACVGGHEWGGGCERRTACIARRAPDAQTSRLAARVPVDTIFETGIMLTATGSLTKKSKQNIVETERTWCEALGLAGEREGEGEKAPSRKRKKR